MLEASNPIVKAKDSYYQNEEKKVSQSLFGSKKYWSILNSFLENKKMPNIPPLFENGEIINDYFSKAEIVNNHFALPCTPFYEGEVEPNVQLWTPLNLSLVTISEEKVIDIIRALDPNKSNWWYG